MKPRQIQGLAAFLSLVLVLLVTAVAHADPTREECIAANEKAQSLQQAHRLRDAHAQLVACVADTCPAVVRDDCVQRLKAVEDATPTIAFGAKDGAGRDLIDVQVNMDGIPFTSHLDGAALEADPGAHEFVFQTPGVEPFKQSFIIREGEKNRHEAVVLGPQPPPPGAAPSSSVGAGTSPWSSQRTIALVVGGVGVVGLGVGSAFGLVASSQWSQAKQDCNPGCNATSSNAFSERTSAFGSATVSTVAFAAGGAALVTAAILWFTAPTAPVQVGPAVGERSGGVFALGRF